MMDRMNGANTSAAGHTDGVGRTVRFFSLAGVVALAAALAIGGSATATASAATPLSFAAPGVTASGATDSGVTRLIATTSRADIGPAAFARLVEQVRLTPGEPRLTAGRSLGFGMHTVLLSQKVAMPEALDIAATIERTPGISQVEPDRVVTATTTETAAPWGLDRIDARSGLDNSYSYDTTGAGVTAYIMDSGIRTTHQEFTGRVRTGFSTIATGGTDDCAGHGTAISGIVGGTIHGVAKGVTLVPVRVLNCVGFGTVSDMIAGINWMVADHQSGIPAVANMSLGLPGTDTGLDAAVNQLIADGVTVVVASGNNSTDACQYSPADVTGAITVNASFRTGFSGIDYRSSFSDFGPCTDIYAPGQAITSSWIGSDTAVSAYLNGTSVAAPHVTGAAARILEVHPSYTPAQVWAALDAASTSIDFGTPLAGDPNKLLFTPLATPSAPAPPMSVAVVGSDRALSVYWTAPSYDGGSSIGGYTATAWAASDGTTERGICTTTGATSCTIGSLDPGSSVVVDVVASNGTGPSDASTPRVSASTVQTAPDAPTIGIATATGATTATVAVTAPASDGGSPVTSYAALSTPPGGTGTLTGPSSGTIAVTGLAPGTSYTFHAVAINAVGPSGSSVESNSVGTPLDVPAAPESPTAVSGSVSATVSWSAPASDGGTAITGYSVSADAGGGACTAVAPVTTCTVAGLVNGSQHSFTVTATNAVGTGAPSPSSNVVTIGFHVVTTSLVPASDTYKTPYASTPLSAALGTGAISWKVTAGALPKGLHLTASTGVISGTVKAPKQGPTTLSYSFTVTATDHAKPMKHTASASFTLTTHP